MQETHGQSRRRSGHILGRRWTGGQSWVQEIEREPGCSPKWGILHLYNPQSVASRNLQPLEWLTDGADRVMGGLLVNATLVAVEMDAGIYQ